MSDRLVERIDASYDTERGLAGLQRRIKRRRVIRGAASAVAVLAVALAVWQLPRSQPTAQLRTDDGSVATPLSPETALTVQSDRADAVELALARGRGHFEVTRKPTRRYRVRSGAVTVEVLGTAFDVSRLPDDATEVRVNHGLVRVRWPSGETLLHAGEHGVFPPKSEPRVEAKPVVAEAEPRVEAEPRGQVEPAVEAEPRVQVEPPAEKSSTARASVERRGRHGRRRSHREQAPRDESWRELARAGKHREAFGVLAEQPVADLEGLLLAADAARLSGHPREAAGHLEHLVQSYPDSAPARLAAFTLGRLQLNELADPQRAAQSFARAYALDPKGPLAEDAMAREAEAYARAGNRARAAELATRYLARFPHGSRRTEMSSYVAR